MNKLSKYFLLSASTCCIAAGTQAQTFNDLLNKAHTAIQNGNNKGTTNGTNNGNSSGLNINNLSNTDVTAALRQALQVGAKNASGRLSATNGFFGNALIKVLMPPEAQKAETVLRNLGMGQVVDKAILSMNRAAEDASGQVVPIFTNAITSMSIQDGITILKGGNGSATNYLRTKTTDALTSSFRPVISSSLSKVGATRYWGDVVNIYNKLPTTINKINPDLTAYVTERALNGLFLAISDEENKIRTNPAARVTDLLQKVFGAH